MPNQLVFMEFMTGYEIKPAEQQKVSGQSKFFKFLWPSPQQVI